ncbi:hypothetical protein MKX03_031101 [Papaver bracteatum]|nr:hypothetical protein MKX03_031101 [Papaver bracteatum]
MHTSRHNIHDILHLHSHESDFLLSCMYGSNNPMEYQEQWQFMIDMQPYVDLPWILLGDLNFTMSDSEIKSFSHHPHQHSRLVRPNIQQLGLLDLGFSGSSTTWSNHRSGVDYTAVRLDRDLANVTWMNSFPLAYLQHIPPVASDHSPILLSTSIYIQKKQSPFWLQRYWFSIASCSDVINTSWSQHFLGSPSYQLSSKLKHTRHQLQLWKKKNVLVVLKPKFRPFNVSWMITIVGIYPFLILQSLH